MIFRFRLKYIEDGKPCEWIAEEELDIIGDYNEVPFGDTYVVEGWYPREKKENDLIINEKIEELKQMLVNDGFTDISIESMDY